MASKNPCGWLILLLIVSFTTMVLFNVRNTPVKVNVPSYQRHQKNNLDRPYNESNFQSFMKHVTSKYPHLKTGKLKPLHGEVCERYRKEPSKEKLVLKSFWGPTLLKDSRDVTFVTQLTYSRLGMLIQVLKHWSGPVSASIYVTWSELTGLYEKFQNIPEIANRTNLIFQAVLKNEEFYPVNFLRNVALNGSLTEYVFLSDVDFVPSIGCYETLRQYVLQGMCVNHTVLVVPAWEVLKKSIQFPTTKTEIIEMWDKQHIHIFQEKTFKVGHHSTNYTKWRVSESVYKIKPEGLYEPYIVMKKTDAPAYRENFLARKFDKISFFIELIAQGFKFLVLPDVFCIHMPHRKITTGIYYKCSVEEFHKLLMELRHKYPQTMSDYNIMYLITERQIT